MQPSLVQQAQDEAEQSLSNNSGQNDISSIASPGSTIDQAQQALQQGSGNVGANTASTTTGNQPNILERLLPTIGSVGGGILGDLVAPVAGGIAGSAAGGAAGKFLEDKLTGQGGGNGVLEAAGESALGQGLGEGAGALLGKGGDLVQGIGKDMANKTATDAANAQQQAAEEMANKAYAAVPKGLRQAHDLDGSLAFADKLGLDKTNPQSLADAGNKAVSLLDDATNDALGQAGPVDASSYNDIVKNAIADKSGILGSFDPVAMARGRLGPSNTPAATLLKQLQGYGAGVATDNADPTAVRGLVQQIGKAYDDATPTVTAATGAKDPVQVATHNTLGEVYNKLKDVVYNRPEVADNFNALPPNITAQDVGGNQAIAEDINQVLSQKGGHQPILDAMKKYGNLSSTGKDAATAAKGLVPTVDKTASASGGLLSPNNVINGGSLLEATLGHHPAALAIPLAVKAAENPAVVNGVGKGLSALGGSMAPGILGSVIGTSPNDVAGAAQTDNAVTSQPFNNSNNPLDQALQNDLQAAQAANADPYLAGNYSSEIDQLPSLIKAVQAVNTAQSAEGNLASNYNLAGGAQGPLGGILDRLGATFTGGEASQYGGQAQADAQAIANATGVPAAQVESSLPKLGENQSAAQASLGNIQSLIQALTQGNYTGGVVGAAQK